MKLASPGILVFMGHLIAWLGALAIPSGSLLAVQSDAHSPPNIVMILSDDQSWTDYGFMGHKEIETPHLDRLARQSVAFRRGYVATALCRPSLATLITGLYAHQHGVTGNDPAGLGLKRNSKEYAQLRQQLIDKLDACQTLPNLLKTKGYLSFQCGKWWEGPYQHGGFTHGMTRGYPNPGGRHGDDGLKIGREGMQPIGDFMDLAQKEDKPFLIWYAPFLPHEPHTPPKDLLEKYQSRGLELPLARYYAMCEWFDQTCGQLMQQLEERELTNNTLVVYVTDNGWIQRAEQSNGGSFADRSKQSPYEGGVRTPILFRWPGVLPSKDRPELCSSIDIVPTILAAAGVDIPEEMPGRNLLPYLKDSQPLPQRSLFGESYAHDIVDLDEPEATLNHRWVINGPWKLILSYDGQERRVKYPIQDYRPQLYNLKEDPAETANVAGEHAEIVAKLAEELNQWYSVKQRKTVIKWAAEPIPSLAVAPEE